MHPRSPLNDNAASANRGTATAGSSGPRVPSVSRNTATAGGITISTAALLPSPTAFYHRHSNHHHHPNAAAASTTPTTLTSVPQLGPPPSSAAMAASPSNQNQQQQQQQSSQQQCSSSSSSLNLASDINSRLDTQVEVRVYPCNNNNSSLANNNTPNNKKKFTQFHVKPEGVIIQGTNRNHHRSNPSGSGAGGGGGAAGMGPDLGHEYALHIGRKLQRYELSDTRACQLLVTTHNKSFWVVPAPEAFSRHSGTCRLLGDRKHPPAQHVLQVGDFLRVGSVGVVVIETHDGKENRVLSEEKIAKIMRDTTSGGGVFSDLAETDGENSDDSSRGEQGSASSRRNNPNKPSHPSSVHRDAPTCYMCFDEEDTPSNPMITPCKCLGDTRYVHVDCLRKWHTAEADNQVCFLSSVDATCSVCKTTFRSDFKLKDGRFVKLFKSSLEPPYLSLLVATKHEMAQRLFNTRFQLSFSTLLKPDGKNGTRPLLLGRSSGSDMVLDYRTVSARHATIQYKNGEFVFVDAGSSNGSYLYLRKPVELVSNQPVQFRLGRSMISMKVVNKWNRRFLRAVSRRAVGLGGGGNAIGNGGGGLGGGAGGGGAGFGDVDNRSVGSNEDDVRITSANGEVTRTKPRRTREYIMGNLPPIGTLSQASPQHLDLLFALAYPCKQVNVMDKELAVRGGGGSKRGSTTAVVGAPPSAQVLDPLGMCREQEEAMPELDGLNLNDDHEEEDVVVESNNNDDEEKHTEEEVGQDKVHIQQTKQQQRPQELRPVFDSPGSYNSGIGDVDVTEEEEVVVAVPADQTTT